MPAEEYKMTMDRYWYTAGDRKLSSRDALADYYGTYAPGSQTTGTLARPEDLETFNGKFSTAYDGQIIEGLAINGRLIVNHDVEVRNCWINGGPTPDEASYGAVKAYGNNHSLARFYDCTLTSFSRSVAYTNGIQCKNATIERCDILGTVDGVGFQGGNVDLLGSWIHDLPWYDFDPAQTDGSHNDGIQIHYGSDYLIKGCLIEMGYRTNAGIMINQKSGLDTYNVTIDHNWFRSVWGDVVDACEVGINLAQGGLGVMEDITITNNRFSALASWHSGWGALIDSGSRNIATIHHNYYEGTTDLVRGLHYNGV